MLTSRWISRTTLGLSGLGLVVAGCGAATSAAPDTARLAQRYMAIATPANHVLDRSFDALADHDHNLVDSAALLKKIAHTERAFDRELLDSRLPGSYGTVAARLVRANELRANLTAEAETATTVASLKLYEIDLRAMNVPVEAQVRVLRKVLDLPPPDAS